MLQGFFAFAAFAGGEIVFQIDRRAGHRDHGVDGRLRQQGATEIGMQDGSGGVDDADMAGAAFQFDLRLDLVEDGVVTQELAFALADIRAQLIQRPAALLRHVIAIVSRQQRGAARMIEQAIDGWKLTQ